MVTLIPYLMFTPEVAVFVPHAALQPYLLPTTQPKQTQARVWTTATIQVYAVPVQRQTEGQLKIPHGTWTQDHRPATSRTIHEQGERVGYNVRRR
ncbi:hypothetical protein WDU94_006322 [Cyamophila willieti]